MYSDTFPYEVSECSLIELSLERRVQTERVIRSRTSQFNARVKRAQIENYLSYCINACDLCRSERAIRLAIGSVTRFGNLLYFGQLFKAFGNIILSKSPTFLGKFCKCVKNNNFSFDIIFRQLL